MPNSPRSSRRRSALKKPNGSSSIFRPLSTSAYSTLAPQLSSPSTTPADTPDVSYTLLGIDSASSSLHHSATSTPVVVQPPNSSALPFRNRGVAADDLGDDDSFTPEIVSGYHFNVPLALDSLPTSGTTQQQQLSTLGDRHLPSQSSDSSGKQGVQVENKGRVRYRSLNRGVEHAVHLGRLLDDTCYVPPVNHHGHQPQQSRAYVRPFPPLLPDDEEELADEEEDDLGDDDVYDDSAAAIGEGIGDMHVRVGPGIEHDHYDHNYDDRCIQHDQYYVDELLKHDDSSSSSQQYQHHHHQSVMDEPDHDHRTDGIYNDDLDDIGDWIASTAPKPGTDITKQLSRAAASATSTTTNQQQAKMKSHSNVTKAKATAALHTQQRHEDRRRDNLARDKIDRATVEQVLDPRTRMILFRLLSRNRLRTLDGCVSTGKEANVYYATASSLPGALADINGIYPPNPGLLPHDAVNVPDAPVAVKVFKTSILQFKDRERYVSGEFRFRRAGYQRSSNRKMVQQWAEKEFRNQSRLLDAGIPAPIPLLLKPPVLIMSFFGKDGWPAPRLKDAALSVGRLSKAYFNVCIIMRKMFHIAKLVHGDLSEYNMLYWNGRVVIIDVSQSVEDHHPMASDFLRRDCANVNDFFKRSGVAAVLSVRELFDFVTLSSLAGISDLDNDDIQDEQESSEGDRVERQQEDALHAFLERAGNRTVDEAINTQQDDEVFMRSFIPRTLQEVEIRESHLVKPTPRNGLEEVDTSLLARLTRMSLSPSSSSSAQQLQKTAAGSAPVNGYAQVGGEEEENSAISIPYTGQEHGHGIPAYMDAVGGNGGVEGMSAPNLEAPCVEPTTFRIKDNGGSGVGGSSGITSVVAGIGSQAATASLLMTSGDKQFQTRHEHVNAANKNLNFSQGLGTGSGSNGSWNGTHIDNRQKFEDRELDDRVVDKDIVGSARRRKVVGGGGGGGGNDDVDDTYDMNDEDDDDEESECSDEYDEDDEENWRRKHYEDDGGDGEDEGSTRMGMSKKDWKKKVKAENKERREQKTPKHVRKRKEALAKRRRGTK